MKNLKDLLFKAKRIDKEEYVTGKLELIDFDLNTGGYCVVINDGSEKHIVYPDSIELLLKPHEDYDFINHDKVFVENDNDTCDYFELFYCQDTADWVLIPYTDKNFTEPKKNRKGKVIGEPLISFGYDMLNRVADYAFDELY